MSYFFEVAHANSAPEEVHAETAINSGEESLLHSLGINGVLFGSQFINFVLVIAVVWFLILKPVTKKMTERQKMIDDSLENAKRINERLLKSDAEYAERINQAKIDANAILQKSNQESEELAAKMKETTKKDVEKLVAQAKQAIQQEKEVMAEALKKETADLVFRSLEKILSVKMTSAEDKKMVQEMVAKMSYEK